MHFKWREPYKGRIRTDLGRNTKLERVGRDEVPRNLVKELVTQSCLTLYDPMDCSPPGFSVQEYWSGSPSPGYLLDSGIELDLLHCKQILYCLSHQASPGNPIVIYIMIIVFDTMIIASFNNYIIIPFDMMIIQQPLQCMFTGSLDTALLLR